MQLGVGDFRVFGIVLGAPLLFLLLVSMDMAGNLQRWERDPLFSAAEIVQDSADRMESAFRTLLHEKSFLGNEPVDQKLLNSIEFHRRDLLTALGTTKWQLEDFERAVGLSGVYHKVSLNTDAASRHSQFIKAIREQITLMEQNLQQPSIQNGKGDNQWVSLNEQDKDQLALFLSGGDPSDEPTASGLDDGSDEIIELKVDETHNYEQNICQDTKFLRHSDYGIQSKSAPHLNYLDQKQFAASQVSSEMDCNGEQKSNEQMNSFFQGTIGNRNHGIYADSRTWDVEGTGTTKNRLKSFRSRVDLRGLLSYLSPTTGAKMSRSFIKRRKDGETSHGYVLHAGKMPSSSATDIFSEQGLINVMLPRIWMGSLQRKFQRIHNFLRYNQFPVRVTPMIFVTLGVIVLSWELTAKFCWSYARSVGKACLMSYVDCAIAMLTFIEQVSLHFELFKHYSLSFFLQEAPFCSNSGCQP